MQAGGLRLLRREVRVALPGVRAGLKAGCVFEIEAGLVFQIVREEFCFDLRAEFLADGLAVVEIAEVAQGRRPIAVTPGTEDQKVLVVRVVRLELGVLHLRPVHIFLVVVAADGERGHGDRVEMHARRRASDQTVS